jgi:hypothetical protein
MATQDSRIKLKRSTVNSTVPTVPSSNDHTDGTWIATDIYKGELFYNQADGVLWTRGDSGIECIQGTAKLTIATADVLHLNTTPIEIVAAPGAGYAIEVISASMKMVYNSVAYATNTALSLVTSTANLFQFQTEIAQTADCFSKFESEDAAPDGVQFVDNQALNVKVASGDPTAGDSDITVYVTYRIITL